MKEKLKSALIIVGILFGGFAVSGLLAALRAEPPREVPPSRAPLVETTVLEQQSGSLSVSGTGTVAPTREIVLAAQVGGTVTWVSPKFKSGGSFSAGQVLARVEDADYKNAVDVAQAEVTQRDFDLLRAREEVVVARDEWDRAAKRSGVSTLPDSTTLGRLAFREPQLALAEAALAAAQARLRDAQLRLDRTAVVAPFAGRIQSKLVDLGQFVAPGQGVAAYFNTDMAEVSVSLSREQMDLIDPSWNVDRLIPATVSSAVGSRTIRWEGFVDRIDGTLDPATRQVSAVVRVARPYRASADRPPLLAGSFVDVTIDGAVVENYFEIPRESVHDRDGAGAEIWVLDGDRLAMHPVSVTQRRDDVAVIQADDLPDSIQLITSELLVVTDGMTVRTASGQ